MIACFAMTILALAAILAASGIGFAVLVACSLISHCRAERAAIRQADFDDYADEAIRVTGPGLWSDEENEILLGRRPFR